jgi:hypothetical protein
MPIVSGRPSKPHERTAGRTSPRAASHPGIAGPQHAASRATGGSAGEQRREDARDRSPSGARADLRGPEHKWRTTCGGAAIAPYAQHGAPPRRRLDGGLAAQRRTHGSIAATTVAIRSSHVAYSGEPTQQP